MRHYGFTVMPLLNNLECLVASLNDIYAGLHRFVYPHTIKREINNIAAVIGRDVTDCRRLRRVDGDGI